jgi:hypothetical protein
MNCRRITSNTSFIKAVLGSVLVVTVLVQLSVSSVFAAFGDDVEKPKPEFTKNGSVITAKLLPRGKSNSIAIGFNVHGGEFTDIQSIALPRNNDSVIDPKDFRSDLFAISISNVQTGGEINLTVSSDYFSSSTRFFVYNDSGTPSWIDAQAQYKTHPADKVRELSFIVKDGGKLDADGVANGKILLKAGPKDSFWGYAVGTLFIRFFGVFLVLTVLQIGMTICGIVFESIGKEKSEVDLDEQALAQIPASKSVNVKKINSELVAAISIALHMELASGDVKSRSGEILEAEEMDIDPDIVEAVTMVLHMKQQEK